MKTSQAIFLMAVLIRAIVGPLLFQYVLWTVFHRDVPWFVDLAVGIYFCKWVVRTAVVVLVLEYCGVPLPMWEWFRSLVH